MMTNPARLQVHDDTSFIMGFHHLIGFAVELYLKSFLLHHGISESDLRSKQYGHKLAALLTTATELRLNCPSAEKLCTYLRKHETFEYRYIRKDSHYDLWSLDVIFDHLGILDARVDHAIGASAAYGQFPGPGWPFPEVWKYWRVSA